MQFLNAVEVLDFLVKEQLQFVRWLVSWQLIKEAKSECAPSKEFPLLDTTPVCLCSIDLQTFAKQLPPVHEHTMEVALFT